MEKSVGDALRLLLANEAFLLKADAAERAIAARLAAYLAPHFPKHQVDVEYNRHGLDPKVVNLPPNCRGGGARRIFPDVIVHQRGHGDENVLVIQIKKETNREPRACDRAVIEAMKRELRYKWGLMIDLPAGPGAKSREARLEWL
jgi:hypothetical protein